MSEQDTPRSLPLAVLVQPDPILEERAGPWRTLAMGLAACAVVVLVLYGMSRPEAPQQMAASSEASQAAPAQTAQPNSRQPTTTGQGSSSGGQATGQAGKPQTPPAPGGNATGTTAGPGVKPAPEAH